MSKARRIFTKEGLIAAAKAGDEIGFNQWIDDMGLFQSKIEACGLVEFPIVWSMVHEHIACLPVEPHMRVEVGLGNQGTDIFDIEMKVYDRLPFEGEAEEWQSRLQLISEFVQSVEGDSPQKAEFFKAISFPLSHILAQTKGCNWQDTKCGLDEKSLRDIAKQVLSWRGDRPPGALMYRAFEVISLSLECAAVDDPVARECEEFMDALINQAAQYLSFSENQENSR